MLTVRDLCKRYGDAPVFEGVNFTVARGERVAILGESGVGKSTLLNALAGLDRVDGGTVEVDGLNITALDEEAAARWRRSQVGFVFQAFHVLPHLSVGQNVGLPLMLLGVPERERLARIEALLEAVGLSGFGDRAPRTLSGGQLQRVAIARALVHRPPLVLADEPTGNLDPDTAEQVMGVLERSTREHGSALVLVTHATSAARHADRLLRLGRCGMMAVEKTS